MTSWSIHSKKNTGYLKIVRRLIRYQKNNDKMNRLHGKITLFLTSEVDFRHQIMANPLKIHRVTSFYEKKLARKLKLETSKLLPEQKSSQNGGKIKLSSVMSSVNIHARS